MRVEEHLYSCYIVCTVGGQAQYLKSTKGRHDCLLSFSLRGAQGRGPIEVRLHTTINILYLRPVPNTDLTFVQQMVTQYYKSMILYFDLVIASCAIQHGSADDTRMQINKSNCKGENVTWRQTMR